MLSRTLICLICVLLWPVAVQAGGQGCDDLSEMAEKIHALRDENAEQGVAKAEDVLERLHLSGIRCLDGELQVLRALASNLHILGRSREGLVRMQRARELMDEMPGISPERRARVHLTLGVLHWDLEAHDEAIIHYLESLQASEEAGDIVAAARAAGNIGNLYNTTGDYRRAREYHERALSGFEEVNWPIGIAGTLVNLAALAGRMAREAETAGDLASAQEEFHRMLEVGQLALDQFSELDNRRGIAHAAGNIATALTGLGRPDEALGRHEQALEMHREVGDAAGEVQALMSMAETRKAMGALEEAEALLELANDQLPDDNLSMAQEIAARRVAVAEARGDYRMALEHQKAVTALRRTIAANQMAARVEEVRLATEAEQREQELALLRSEAEIADLRLKRQRATTLAAVLMAILFFALLALVLGLYRSRITRSRELERVARTDPLTGLANRRDMMERLEAARADCVKDGRVHSLILADLDDFKEVNDRYGHGVGDEVLQQLAQRLGAVVKVRDVVGRWGGEEFVILLPETDADGARVVAENLRAAVAGSKFSSSAGEFSLTLTMGVAELTSALSVDQVVQRADVAMYRGKEAGKNRSVVHPSE